MAVVRADFPNVEQKLVDDVIDEVDRVELGMFVIDFERAHAGRLVDRGILEVANLHTLFSYKSQELDIHLDVVASTCLL